MTHHSNRQSLATAALCVAVILTGCDSNTELRTAARYLYTTGHVTELDDQSETVGYYITVVSHEGSPTPWLIVAKPVAYAGSGFTTESSGATDAVSVDGVEYEPIVGHCILVYDNGDVKERRELETAGNQTLTSIRDGLGGLSVANLSLMLGHHNDGSP